jgi:ABC-2 type transport system permease protein
MGVGFVIALNSMKSKLAYRTDMLFSFGTKFVIFLVQLGIWNAVFSDSEYVTTDTGNVDILMIFTYVTISAVISVFFDLDPVWKMEQKVSKGEISLDLVKPISPIRFMYYEVVGINISKLILEALPFIVIVLFIQPIGVPSVLDFILFVLSVILAIHINFLLGFLLGLFSLYYVHIYPLKDLLSALIRLFSGAIVPLWFFPDWLSALSSFLPFQHIYFSPISIFISDDGLQEKAFILLLQLGWIFGLLLLYKLIWNWSVKKLQVQGG